MPAETGKTQFPPHVVLVHTGAWSIAEISYLLESDGFVVHDAATPAVLLEQVGANQCPDLIILDVDIPYDDPGASLRPRHEGDDPVYQRGYGLCRRLRRLGYDAAILFLTCDNAVESRVAGLYAGADDYIGIPYEPSEFLARARAVVRRHWRLRQALDKDYVRVADVGLNIHELIIIVPDKGSIALTRTEAEVLWSLMINAGRPMSRAQLYEEVWGYSTALDSSIVETNIKRIRNKIEENPKEPKYLLTIRNRGYVFINQQHVHNLDGDHDGDLGLEYRPEPARLEMAPGDVALS